MARNINALYTDVCDRSRRIALITSIESTLYWDQSVYLPPQGGDYRAEQTAYISGLTHECWTDQRFGDELEELVGSELAADPDSDSAVVIRKLKRARDKKTKLSQTLVEELTRASILGQQAWQEAKRASDYAKFQPHLEKMIALKREQAQAIGYTDALYDALLDDYEPETKTAEANAVLVELRKQLVPLVANISESKKKSPHEIVCRRFPEAAQATFVVEAAKAMGFNFDAGRLDVTEHPFCTTMGPKDCRITTHYYENHFNAAFFGVLHEAGHGLYEQGLKAENFGLPVGEAVSLGIHESQSRLWENFVGRGLPFWRHFFPAAQMAFSEALGNVALDDFYFAVNDSRPSLIRIEADEATYNLHILIRFELEQDLLGGALTTTDLPGAWNEKYEKYLGVRPKNDAEGALQDVHWSAGLIGYFPTYSLGNLYAAQFFDQAKKDLGDLDERFAKGDFSTLREWLRENIHKHGQRYSAAELARRVTGRPLSPEPLMRHLNDKFGALYGF